MTDGPRLLFALHATAARRDRELSDPAFRTLCALAEYANREGVAWPAIATLSADRGVSKRSVQYHLRELETRGHIRTIRAKRHAPNVYVLLFGRRRRGLRLPEHGWHQPELFDRGEAGMKSGCAPGGLRGATGLHGGGEAGLRPNNTNELKSRARARESVNGHRLNGSSDGQPIGELLGSVGNGALKEALTRLARTRGQRIIEEATGNGRTRQEEARQRQRQR